MKIGMAGASMMLSPWLTALRTAVDNGFGGFEIFGEFPQCVCGEVVMADRAVGRGLVQDRGIELAVHAPFNSLNIAALNPGIREESVRQQKDAVELCSDLGGRIVIVHTGEYVVPRRVRREIPDAEKFQWDFNIIGLRQIAAFAREQGVIVCLENIGFEPDHMDRTVEDLVRIKNEVDEPALAFCIDVGHARLNNEIPAVLERMGPLTAHVHFTDNFGEKDDHTIIGEGNFDYAPFIPFLKSFAGTVTLEVVKIATDPGPAVKSKANFEKIMGL